MNFLSTVLFSSLLWSIVGSPYPPEQPKQIEVAIDTTIEAIVVLFGLAEDESDRRFSTRVTPLMQKSIAHFTPFRNHEAVRVMRELKNRRWLDGLIQVGVLCSQVPNAELLHPLPHPLAASFSRSNDQAAGNALVRRFLPALNAFYRDADVAGFLEDHRTIYEGTLREVQSGLPPEGLIEAMEAFYGEERAAYQLIPSPLVYRGNGFGPLLETTVGPVASTVFGPFQETVNTPESGYGFDDPEMIHFFATHEFGHSFVSPLLDSPEHRDQVAALRHLMEPVRDEMRRVGYSRWDIVLEEHIVRLGEIRIALSMGDDEEAERLRTHHVNERGFIYLPALEKAVVVYEEHRGEFPSLEDFLTTLLETLAEPGRGT